jgi:hypothetical protein
MVELVTLAQAQSHLRVDSNDDAVEIIGMIKAASKAVLNYLKGAFVYEPLLDSYGDAILDSSGDPIAALDSSGDPIVQDEIQMATLILIAVFYRNREGYDTGNSRVGKELFQPGYLPEAVKSLLYPLRTPALG